MNFYLLFIPSFNQICNCHLQFLIKYSNYTNFKKCPKEQVILSTALLLLSVTWVLLWAINEIVHHLINWTDWLKIFSVNKESVLGELTWNLVQALQPFPMTTDTLYLSTESKHATLIPQRVSYSYLENKGVPKLFALQNYTQEIFI